MPIRLSGMSSGLDTEALVTALVSSYSLQKDNLVKAQTKLSWKQDAWKTMNTKIYGFYTGTLSSMQYSKNYALKKATISNSNYATVSASTSAVTGTQSLKVKKMAASGYLTGGQIAAKASSGSSKITGDTKLSAIQGMSDSVSGNLKITSEGKTSQIALSSDMTVNQFVAKLKDAGVNANFDENNQRFFVSAKTSGADHDFSLSAVDANGNSALNALGLNGATVNNLDEVIRPYKAVTDNANYVDETAQAAYDSKINQFNAGLKNQLSAVKSQNQQNTLLSYQKQYAQSFAATASASSLTDASDALDAELATLRTRKQELDQKNTDGTITDDEKTELSTVSTKISAASTVLEKMGNGTWTDTDRTNYVNEIETSLNNGTDKLNTLTEGILNTYREAGIISATDTTSVTIDAEKGSVQIHDTVGMQNKLKDDGTIDTDNYTYTQAIANGSTIATEARDAAQADYDYAQRMVDAYNVARQGETAPGYAAALSQLGITSTGGIGAVRVYGSDSEIELNGATFKNNTNTYSINGLTITATAVTGDTAVSITTENDVDGIYDQIKSFLSEYNSMIKDIDTAYNASSAKGYEPLTSEEKSAMTDDEVDKWEKKVKDSLLRKDSTLGAVSSALKTDMLKSFNINGKNYSLASFGITTAGYFTSTANERGVFHIDGDEDDATTKSNTDKLKAAIANDPDAVISFFSQLSQSVYKDLGKRMQTSSISSAFTIYNDKELAKEYSDYTTKISNKEDEVSKWEDYYYTKFTRMESALASLNSQSSSLSGLF